MIVDNLDLTLRRLLEAGAHPAWWWNLLKHKRAAPIHYIQGPRTIASATAARPLKGGQRPRRRMSR